MYKLVLYCIRDLRSTDPIVKENFGTITNRNRANQIAFEFVDLQEQKKLRFQSCGVDGLYIRDSNLLCVVTLEDTRPFDKGLVDAINALHADGELNLKQLDIVSNYNEDEELEG